MNKFFVWLVSRFDFLWSRLGADPRALALILSVKLKMDDRVGYVMGRQQSRKTDMQYLVFGMAFLLGGIFLLPLIFMEHQATALGLTFSFWMVYVGFLLITEMSESLFDTRDLYILLSRPLNGVTLSLARMLHIGVFTSKFVLCLGFIPGGYLLLWQGPWAFVVYVLLALLVVVVTMTSTLVLYLLILRNVAPEKVRSVTGYFQIVATIFFFGLYQLPSLLNFSDAGVEVDFSTWHIVGENWGFAFPGLWIAALWSLLVAGGATLLTYAQAGLGIVASAAGLWFYVRKSSNYGDTMLSMRHAGSQDASELDRPRDEQTGHPLRDRWARWFTRPNLERASFKFHWNMMLRDVNFKQGVYPGLVILPVMVLYSIFNSQLIRGNATPGESLTNPSTVQLLVILYLFCVVVVIPLAQTRVSLKFKASWIFDATPLKNQGALRYGQLLAVWCMFYLPMAVLFYPVLLGVWGIHLLPDVLISSGATLIITMIYHGADRSLPFSQDKQTASFNSVGPMILTFVLAPIFGVGHYFLAKVPYLVYAGVLVVWGIVWVMLRELRAGKD